ncbi:MAG: DUF1003 domain-containing protein [Pseudonocardia sp.]|nr:DUF1003 domain-containing protein [Pseudonocardia sp.]
MRDSTHLWHWHPRVPHALNLTQLDHGIDRLARFLATPQYLLGQTVFIIVWITLNSVHGWHLFWDGYPYILLNLAFSTQAAYAAPIILYKQVRDGLVHEAAEREHFDAVKRIEAAHRSHTEALSRIERKLVDLTAEAMIKRALRALLRG